MSIDSKFISKFHLTFGGEEMRCWEMMGLCHTQRGQTSGVSFKLINVCTNHFETNEK